jgi:hypothetical protein
MLSKDMIKAAGLAAEASLAIFGETLAAEMAPTLFGFGSQSSLIRRGGASAARKWFWDPRTYKTVASEYWKIGGGAAGRELHHWFLPQRWLKKFPEYFPTARRALTNAGFNLVELPGWLNNWLGRGALRELKELAFRAGVLSLLYAEFKASYEETSRFLRGGAPSRSVGGNSNLEPPSSRPDGGIHLAGRDWSARLLQDGSSVFSEASVSRVPPTTHVSQNTFR